MMIGGITEANFANMGGTGGAGGASDPEMVSGGAGTGGSVPAPPAQGADGPDAGVDARDAGAGITTCDQIVAAYDAQLAEAQDCSGGEACTHSFIGTGCFGGVLPLCGVSHRDGYELSSLSELDETYRQAGCGGAGPISCAACAQVTVACVAGRCTQQP